MIAASSSPHPTLPIPLTTLVGREREIASIGELLRRPEVRLVTLTGPGGVGKTRLALAVADQAGEAFPDGVVFVSLASVRDPQLVPSAIAQALGVREAGDEALIDRVADAIGRRRLLLVLDNFEHLLDDAPLVSRLLVRCPALTALMTSRAVLHLSPEHVVPVAPLGLPDPRRAQPLERLREVEATRLFVERACAASGGFALTEANAATVATICTRLDGLPLAIELAAARTRVLPPEALLALLDQRLRLLTGGPQDAPARQQTMREAIAWSDDLLAPDEQRLLRQLSVFAGGWTLEAAEAVCDADLDVLTGLTRLIDQSLVQRLEAVDTTARYGMLETIREYAREQLDESGESNAVQTRHARYFFSFADVPEAEGLWGPDQARWLHLLDAERDNLRAAFSWGLETGHFENVLRLGAWLWRWWDSRGHNAEGCRWLEAALADGGDAPIGARAAALGTLGQMEKEFSRFDRAEQLLDEALVLFQSVDDGVGLADVLTHRGDLEMYQGRYALADDLFAAAVEHARGAGAATREGIALSCRGLLRTARGDFAGARSMLQESLGILKRSGDLRAIGNASSFLGYAELVAGHPERTITITEACIAAAREVGDNMIVALALQVQGFALTDLGEMEPAWRSFSEALALDRMLGQRDMLTRELGAMATIIFARRDPVRAARVMGAASALREQIGAYLEEPMRPRFDRLIVAIRAELGDATFDAAWSAGRELTLEEAIACALESRPPAAPPSPDAPGGGLSPRELEVVRLLAEGRTNQEIAAALGISPYTAVNHVRNIMNKLGLDSRAAVAGWAVRAGLA